MLPEIVAHRGTPRTLRENTLPGFLAALAEGADAVELDVHATRDGVVVVHHDSCLPAITAPSTLAGRAIAELTLAELQSAHLPGSTPERPFVVPALREVLAAVGERATVYVEVKASGIEALVLQAVREAAAAGVRCAVHAFDHRIAREVAAAPDAPPTGILVQSYLVDAAHALRAAGARDYWSWWEFIDADLVRQVHDAGGRVVAWTVNDVDVARRLAEAGVDALCTDLPGMLRGALVEAADGAARS